MFVFQCNPLTFIFKNCNFIVIFIVLLMTHFRFGIVKLKCRGINPNDHAFKSELVSYMHRHLLSNDMSGVRHWHNTDTYDYIQFIHLCVDASVSVSVCFIAYLLFKFCNLGMHCVFFAENYWFCVQQDRLSVCQKRLERLPDLSEGIFSCCMFLRPCLFG